MRRYAATMFGLVAAVALLRCAGGEDTLGISGSNLASDGAGASGSSGSAGSGGQPAAGGAAGNAIGAEGGVGAAAGQSGSLGGGVAVGGGPGEGYAPPPWCADGGQLAPDGQHAYAACGPAPGPWCGDKDGYYADYGTIATTSCCRMHKVISVDGDACQTYLDGTTPIMWFCPATDVSIPMNAACRKLTIPQFPSTWCCPP